MNRTGPAAKPPGEATIRIAPFVVFLILMGLEPYIADLLAPVLDRRWLYGLRSAVTLLVLLAFWKRYAELHTGPRPAPRIWLLSVAVGIGVFLFWIALDFRPLAFGHPDVPFDPRVDGAIHAGFALTRLAGSALVVPVIEELFWRSFLMRWLEKPAFLQVAPRAVGWKPLVISSAVFALEHSLWFAGLLAGLVYGELYRRTGSLWVVILAHAVTNAVLGAYVLWTGHWWFW